MAASNVNVPSFPKVAGQMIFGLPCYTARYLSDSLPQQMRGGVVLIAVVGWTAILFWVICVLLLAERAHLTLSEYILSTIVVAVIVAVLDGIVLWIYDHFEFWRRHG